MTQANALNRIMVNVNGAPQDVVELEFLAAVHDFFKRTGIWVGTITSTTVSAQQSYSLTPAADRVITLVDQVTLGGQLLHPLPQHAQPYNPGYPYYEYDQESGQLILAEDPSGAYDLVTTVWYRPVELVDVPAFAWKIYEDALVDGALTRLLSHQAKPYTNPMMAAMHHRKYQGAIAQAKRRMLTSNVRADLGWNFPDNGVRGRTWR
jgi:hypothetical protein